MNFETFGLDPRINAGVTASGYLKPTPIQEQAIPSVLAGRDLLGLAQTGTGKTAAFVLPILQRLLQKQEVQSQPPASSVQSNDAQANRARTLRARQMRAPAAPPQPLRPLVVRALILAPTRELAEQIHQSIVILGQKTRLRSVPIYGGVGKYGQLAAMRQGPEIMVACPGRLLDHLQDGVIDLSKVEVFVLDEADRMCDMGFLPDIRRVLSYLPRQRQTLFFSATMPDDIRTLSSQILTDPVTVQIGMRAPVETVSHALYPVHDKLKTRLLFSMLEETPTGRVVVFTRTKRRARNLAADLEDKRYRVAELQGNMAQNRRQEAIHGFRTGKYDILVATDIAARGIDVSEITHVINFDMPDTVDAYTHRIGRTGRAEQTGDAFTFVTPGDELMVRDIEKVLGKRIERRKLANFDYGDFAVESRGARTRGNASPGKDRRPDQRRAGQAPASRQHAQMPPPVGEGVAEINVAGYHRSHGEQPHVQPPSVCTNRAMPRRPLPNRPNGKAP